MQNFRALEAPPPDPRTQPPPHCEFLATRLIGRTKILFKSELKIRSYAQDFTRSEDRA